MPGRRSRLLRLAATPGKPEAAASRFLAWLGDTGRRWLVVLDGVTEAADIDGLWPHGPSGQALVTTALAGLGPAPAEAWQCSAERKARRARSRCRSA